MGLLYLDATNDYSDPASTTYKYLREDNVWAAPDMEHRFRDATGNWSVPELGPIDISNVSWDEIKKLADLAANNRASYLRYIGSEKSFIYGGYSVTARIVDIAKERTPQGKYVGFIFHIYRGMGTHNMNSANTMSDGYASVAMRTWLEGLAFPSDLTPLLQEFVLRYRASTSASASGIDVKVGLMAASNLYWAGCQGENGNSQRFYADEGEPYQYFKDHDTIQSRIHYNDSGSADRAWLLSLVSPTNFMSAASDGRASSGNASTSRVPAARFCLGSSV